MNTIAILLRAAQLFAHERHHTTSGISFFADHEFLGELYGTYEEAYDSIIERMIGLGTKPNIAQIGSESARHATALIAKPYTWPVLLEIEAALRIKLTEANNDASLGTQNLLAQLADDSEARTYKIQQRGKVKA